MSFPLVIQVLWDLGRAGAERMVFDLARALPQQGFRVRVLAAGGGGAMELEFRAAGIPLVVGPTVRHPWERIRTLRFLQQEFHRERPAIWHTHLGADIWGGVVARRNDFHPWVVTVHGSMQEETWPLSGLRRWAYRSADQVVCVSEDTRQRIESGMMQTRRRPAVIRLGFDTEAFAIPRSVPPVEQLRVLSVGRLVANKNQAVLIRALAALDAPWRLTLLGEGPEQSALQRLAMSLGVDDRIDFVGSVPDVRPFLAEADVLCFPSHHEGQGLAVLEAAAAGVPLLLSDLPVLRQTFVESATYIAPDDVVAWTEVLRSFVQHRSSFLDLARQAQAIVQREFSLSRMVHEYAALYRRLL